MTSALLRNGPDHLRPLEVQVRDWMDRHGFEALVAVMAGWSLGQRGRPWRRASTDLAIRRCRVSSVLAPVTWRTCQDLLL
jgi:hypothetical protein